MAKSLFISHSWTYSERYNSMEKLLRLHPNFQWRNYSVPETKAFGPMAKYRMKEELRQQIRPAQCVIIIGGMWMNHSEWIKFEMEFAKSLRKPMLGVKPRGALRMPVDVVKSCDKIVNWNTESIVAGIGEIS